MSPKSLMKVPAGSLTGTRALAGAWQAGYASYRGGAEVCPFSERDECLAFREGALAALEDWDSLGPRTRNPYDGARPRGWPGWPSRLLDALLGPRCPSCGARVFPRDEPGHPAYCRAA